MLLAQQQGVNSSTDNKHSHSNEMDSLNHDIGKSVDKDKDNSIDKRYPNVIDIDKAIIVSDLHLGYEKCNSKAFLDFLLECISKGISKEYSLFILGDFWDLWRKHDIIYSTESDEILSLVNQFKDVYYLPGNHDHITLDTARNHPDFNCYNINRYLRIKCCQKNLYIVNEHELKVI